MSGIVHKLEIIASQNEVIIAQNEKTLTMLEYLTERLT